LDPSRDVLRTENNFKIMYIYFIIQHPRGAIMKRFLILIALILSSKSFANTYTFDCPSRGIMKLDTEKSTFEWGRFGQVPTEFKITEDDIELLKPFGKKYFFKFILNSGDVYVLQNGSQNKFDSCTVTKKEKKPTEKQIVKINSDFRNNKYKFNCVKDGRYARDRGGYIITFDFPNSIVEWITSAHDEIKDKKIIDIYEVSQENPVYGDGGYKKNDNILYTKSYDNYPRYFNLETGDVLTNYNFGGRDLEKEFLDGRWVRGLDSQSCVLSVSETKVDKQNIPRFSLSKEFNNLSPENKVIIRKYILEFSDFKDKDNIYFDPLSKKDIKYSLDTSEKFSFDNLFIDYLIQLSGNFEDDSIVVSSDESANNFLKFLIRQYSLLSSTASSDEDIDNYIDEKSIQDMCFNTITYLENAVYIFASNLNPNGYFDSKFLTNLFRNFGIDVLSLKNYNLNNKFGIRDIKSSEEQKYEYCTKESNLVNDYAGRELIQENTNSITKFMILETNSLEREKLNGSWFLGDSFMGFDGVTTGSNGRSSYNAGSNTLGRQISEELKQVLSIPFVVFVHKTNKENGASQCFVQFTGFSKTTEVKNILNGRESSYADGFSLSYWGVPLQFYSPRDEEGMYFIGGTGQSLNVSNFYSPFENKFDFDSFKNNYNDLIYTNSNIVPLKIGNGVSREKNEAINSIECTQALKLARNEVASYLSR